MNLRELITEYRAVSCDQALPYLWTDIDLKGYANQAECEACRRALLIADTDVLSVAANDPLVVLDPLALFVRRVRLETAARNLKILSWRRVEEVTPDWEALTATPFVAIPNWVTGAVRLHPTPVADDSARIAFFRLPRRPMVAMGDSPEINVRYHKSLVDHMLELGYGKHDADAFDPAAAAFYGARFTTIFGPPASGVAEAEAERDVSRSRHAR